jgi:tRNA (guanine37-N1)-methyltransferase
VLYKIFTLYPAIFDSFLNTSLIARGLNKDILEIQRVNWREDFGLGRYRQVDDRPFGGGTGMVLRCEPIFAALNHHDAVSSFFKPPSTTVEYYRREPNNSKFYDRWLASQTNSNSQTTTSQITVSLTPRGFPIDQKIMEWLTSFGQINILCGRYEGFDARVSEAVDVELSLGNFVLNGGEVASMAMIEGISRLLPGFVTKDESVLHESFSKSLNQYPEQTEFVTGKRRLAEHLAERKKSARSVETESRNEINLFDDKWWTAQVQPNIEHPQFTRPEVWQDWRVPQILMAGNHKLIQNWRRNWWLEPLIERKT